MLILGDSLLNHLDVSSLSVQQNIPITIESISGCTINNLINLLSIKQFIDVLELHSSLVVVIGTNNISTENCHLAITKVRKFIHLLCQRHPNIHLTFVKIPYRTKNSVWRRAYGDNGGKNVENRVKFFNKKLELLNTKLSSKIKFDLIEFKFTKHEHLHRDGLHPNRSGTSLIAHTLSKYINEKK
ncbi:unnamed protein product [Didymodactylos carnosus]|uniref:SGNH hydrolase-type esterase domain-containing protein n=1 Tax=Didymodactylos carnosus TaxID=1234261 RepID=A0A814UNI6_9BILA|nr:unnamed protein product [Didymodactylos carnosus]CAF3942155.1 unnamed protein product [Didymodactylos carnosus]